MWNLREAGAKASLPCASLAYLHFLCWKRRHSSAPCIREYMLLKKMRSFVWERREARNEREFFKRSRHNYIQEAAGRPTSVTTAKRALIAFLYYPLSIPNIFLSTLASGSCSICSRMVFEAPNLGQFSLSLAGPIWKM